MEEEKQKQQKDIELRQIPGLLDISWGTIVKIAVALTSLYLIFLVRDILIWFVFALIISILFNPAINFLRRRLHFHRVLAAILVYLSLFVLLGGLVWGIAPLLFSELQEFSTNFTQYFNQASFYFSGLNIKALHDFQSFTNSISGLLSRASLNLFTAVGAIFGGILSTITIFSIAFFLSLEEEGLTRVIQLASPKDYKDKVLTVWKRSQKKISAWFGVRLICCLFIGLAIGATCYALNIPYAAFFGLFAAVFNIILAIGPLFSGSIITLLVLSISGPAKAIIFLIAFVVAQMIEGHILMPTLSKRVMRLSPSLVLVALLVGAKLWGVLGAILAIPLTGMLFEFIKGFLERKNEEKIVSS